MPGGSVLARGRIERIAQPGGDCFDYTSAIRKYIAAISGEGKARASPAEVGAVDGRCRTRASRGTYTGWAGKLGAGRQGFHMASGSWAGSNPVGAIDRSMVERIVRQVVLEHLGRAKNVPALAPGTYGGGAAQSRGAANPKLFYTPEAEAIKKEICAVGRKLWMRQFVDGNGGNISYRIGPNEVICTPALVSKFDLTPED